MKILLNVVGLLLVLAGSVWALQGMSILPGKVMGGHKEWIVYGLIAITLGIVALLRANRRGARSS